MMTQTVQPPLDFIPPTLNPWVVKTVQRLSPLWLHWYRNVSAIESHNLETAVQLFDQFQRRQTRLMLAFRHPSIEDPLCINTVLGQHIPRKAQQLGIRLSGLSHAHFIYDRGLPLWVGPLVAKVLPLMGAFPIHRGKLDRVALRTARDLLVKGDLPLGIAPEGTINGHNQVVNPLEPGAAQLAFWGVSDLVEAGSPQDLKILPIGIIYKYTDAALPRLEALLDQLELESGLLLDPTLKIPSTDQHQADHLYRRMLNLCVHLLTIMEQHYAHFYGYQAASMPTFSVLAHNSVIEEVRDTLAERLAALMDAALQVSEKALGLKSRSTIVDRRHAIEQASWDRIFRNDIQNIQALSPVERGLADQIAQETSMHMRHMRLVETFIGIAGRQVGTRPTLDRIAETTLHLRRLILRMKGSDPLQQKSPDLGKRYVHVKIGEPLLVSDRWEAYQANRRQAVAELTHDLQEALEKTVA